MTAAISKNNEVCKLVEVSQSEVDQQKYERRGQQIEAKIGRTEEAEEKKRKRTSTTSLSSKKVGKKSNCWGQECL